jgi:ABC-type branched-subunit amino acid transport system substrate-binding protein
MIDMPRLRTRFALPTAVVATMLLGSACGSSGTPASSGSGTPADILIGVPVPVSGDYASAGKDIYQGAQLAAADINGKGGINGAKIQLVEADDACSAQVGAQAAQKLISQGVVAVAGGYCSSAALPELGAFHRVNIPYVMDSSTNPQLTEQGFPEAFRTIGRDDQQGPFAAKYISGFLQAKTAAVINDNTTYAKGLADATVAALKSDNVNVVFNDAITPGQSDYTPVLTRVKTANPDVIYYTGYFSEAALLVKQAREKLGMTNTFMGGDATNDPTLLATAGAAAEGMQITTAPLAQFLGSAGQQYVTNYQKKFGAAPGAYSVYEYDAVEVLAKAMQAAGSTKSSDVVKALPGVKYTGITGDISFNSKGDRASAVYITIIVKNGQFAAYKKQDSSGQWVGAAG